MQMALSHLIASPWKLTDLNRVAGRPLSVEEVDQCLLSAREQATNVMPFVQSTRDSYLICGEQQALNRWKGECHRNDPEPLWGDEVSQASSCVQNMWN